MASLVYNSFLEDVGNANIDCGADTFKVMLVTGDYTPNKDTHNRRDDVTNEVSGTGYTAGGKTVTCTVSRDNATDRVLYTFAATSWDASTISANAAVYYKSRGGASSADELVAYNDFGGTVTSTADTFSVAATVITNQN